MNTTDNTTTTKRSGVKTGWIIVAIIVIAALWLYSSGKNYYNDIIVMDEQLNNTQRQVQNVYERRADLVPQVAAVVKRYAEFEQETYGEIARLRGPSAQLSQLSGMVANGDISSEQFTALLASTLAGIRVAAEAYPELKADQQFNNLFTTLEGSENRIRTEIKNYNDQVVNYNLKVRSFPWGKIYSSLF